MCGIAGIVDFEKGWMSPAQLMAKMTDVMVHRGPDDHGYHIGPHVGMGHRRLSIIDLSGGHQPMYSDDGTKVIIFNGEVYNFQEMQEELTARGMVLKTRSDTEVILKSFEEYGVDCLKKFRGMFAFAIWDMVTEQLFVARDRIGKKPVYYETTGNKIVFASEIKGIFSAGQAEHTPDLDAIDSFLSLGYTLSPQTAFKKINKLPAAHYFLFDRSGLKIQQYWRLQDSDAQPKISDKEGLNLVKETLEKAVSLRMISDVPLGAFLSGGIDSSIIVGIMSKLSTQPVRTFTVGYEDSLDHSELGFARTVAKNFRTDHTEIILKPHNFFELISKMLLHLEEPIGDQACIPLFLMSEEAKKHVTVMLSGEGADELFGGYDTYLLMRFIDYYRRVPAGLRRGLINPIIRRVLDVRRATKYIEWSNKDLGTRYLGDMADLSDDMKLQLYSKDFLRDTSQSFMQKINEVYKEVQDSSDVDKMLYLDIKTWLVEDLLLRTRRGEETAHRKTFPESGR